MAHFKSKTIKGQVYDLAHLDPFTFSQNVDGVEVVVRVEFSSHCFTEKVGPEHTPDLIYQVGSERRAFCVDRYELSKQLPGLIANLGDQRVYHTARGSFLILRDHAAPEGKVPYVVFLRAFRATNKRVDVQIIVESAYLKPGMATTASPVKFSTMLRFTKEGRDLPQGKRQQMRRK